MKIVINRSYGGFNLNQAAWVRFFRLKFPANNILKNPPKNIYYYHPELLKNWPDSFDEKAFRTDPFLIQVIEELGLEASAGPNSKLKIIDIPFETIEGWEICENDGREWIVQSHEIWD